MRKLLVAADDYNAVTLLKSAFAKEGFHVHYMSDGGAVLAEVRRTNPDLVILDVILPGMGGLEICRQFRQDDSLLSVPVILLSYHGEAADRIEGLEMGADDYVAKPFSVRELVARVRA